MEEQTGTTRTSFDAEFKELREKAGRYRLLAMLFFRPAQFYIDRKMSDFEQAIERKDLATARSLADSMRTSVLIGVPIGIVVLIVVMAIIFNIL